MFLSYNFISTLSIGFDAGSDIDEVAKQSSFETFAQLAESFEEVP